MRSAIALYLCALAGAILLAACATEPPVADHAPAEDADIGAIRAARYAQNEAIAVGDLDGIAAFWTEDVIIRPSLGPPIRGRAAYREAFGSDSAGTVFVRRPTLIEVSPHWPLAFESGVWSKHLAGVASPPVITGRYSAQWIKRDGRWRIRAEVFVPIDCDGPGCGTPLAP